MCSSKYLRCEIRAFSVGISWKTHFIYEEKLHQIIFLIFFVETDVTVRVSATPNLEPWAIAVSVFRTGHHFFTSLIVMSFYKIINCLHPHPLIFSSSLKWIIWYILTHNLEHIAVLRWLFSDILLHRYVALKILIWNQWENSTALRRWWKCNL